MTDEAPALVAAGGPPDPVEPPRTRIALIAWGLSILLHAALVAALADLSDRLGSEPEDEVISAEWVIDAPLKGAVAVSAADEAPRAELPAFAAGVAEAMRLALLPSAATTVLEASVPPAAAPVPPPGALAPASLEAERGAAQQPVEASRPIAEPPMLSPPAGGEIRARRRAADARRGGTRRRPAATGGGRASAAGRGAARFRAVALRPAAA